MGAESIFTRLDVQLAPAPMACLGVAVGIPCHFTNEPGHWAVLFDLLGENDFGTESLVCCHEKEDQGPPNSEVDHVLNENVFNMFPQ